jgi:hypothetical protein
MPIFGRCGVVPTGPFEELLRLILGVAAGALFSARTGFATGGIITPGFLAVVGFRSFAAPLVFGLGMLLALVLEAATRCFGLYGRRRMTVAILLSLSVFLFWSAFFPLSVPWSGWLVPGLLAGDAQRQGALPTCAGALAAGAAAILVRELLPF